MLVVVYHVGGTWLTYVVTDPAGVGWFVRMVNELFLPVRMPLFFLTSGLLATTALGRGWRSIVRHRVGDLVWPFVVFTAAFAPLWAFSYGRGWSDVPVALSWIVELSGAYWYLPALAVFFLLTKLSGRFRVVLLVVSGVVWLASPLLVPVLATMPAGVTLQRYATYLAWFVAGATLWPLLIRLASAPGILAIAAAVGWLALAVADASTELSLAPVLSLLGVAAAVMLCGTAVRIRGVATAGRFLGSRTLVVYLIHPMILALGIILLPPLHGSNVVNLVLIGGALVASIAIPMLLRPHLPDWLFRLPAVPSPFRGVRSSAATEQAASSTVAGTVASSAVPGRCRRSAETEALAPSLPSSLDDTEDGVGERARDDAGDEQDRQHLLCVGVEVRLEELDESGCEQCAGDDQPDRGHGPGEREHDVRRCRGPRPV